MKSRFEAWFIAQHGKRERMDKTDDELSALVMQGKQAEEELRRRKEWDARQESALYAYNAFDREGK